MARAPAGPVPVIVMGLGFIGQEIAKAAAASEEVQLVGAVDLDPGKVGRPLGALIGSDATRVEVTRDVGALLKKHKGAVVLQATGSKLEQVAPQLFELFKLGASVVSTCEELSFPFLRYPELAEKLDRAAAKAGVAVLGTGVNPGFVLDRLVACAGQVCGPVQHVRAVRVVDARTRREALQRKIGAGLTEAAFDALADRDGIGHVGLVESAALTALGLGIDCDDFEEELVPVIAEEDILGAAVPVKAGQVAGVSQTVLGLADGQERVRLELTLAVGAEPPEDRITIDSDVRVELQIKGGIAGDRATANTVVNAAPRVSAAEPGLLTVLELPAGR